MNRRRLFAAGAAIAAALSLSAHTPYRQWKLYRQTHLLIFTLRDDPADDTLGERIASRLRELLPESNARVARAPHVQRIASLITTGQADVALLSRADAAGLFHRRPPFQDYAPVRLRVLVETDRYRLVCREDFKPEHAFLVAQALASDPGEPRLVVPQSDATGEDDVPTHAGALAFARGQSLPGQ